MGKVIYKDFGVDPYSVIEPYVQEVPLPAKSGYEYLVRCKGILSIEDYEELLLSIMDEEYYQEAEVAVRALADMYFKFDK